MPDEIADGGSSQPSMEWLRADSDRWAAYTAGRAAESALIEAAYENGTFAGYEQGFGEGYQSCRTDEAIHLGPFVMATRPADGDWVEDREPGLSPREILAAAHESWGLEYPADDADDYGEDAYSQAG